MKAFITGSQAYGTPREDSDIDVVAYLTQAEINLLRRLADTLCGDAESAPDDSAASLRFGRLNLICVQSESAYADWQSGTNDLVNRRPVTRDEAVAHFSALFAETEARERGPVLVPDFPEYEA